MSQIAEAIEKGREAQSERSATTSTNGSVQLQMDVDDAELAVRIAQLIVLLMIYSEVRR